MNGRILLTWLCLAASLLVPVRAQTLVEVTLVTAIASQLYPVVSLPSGSLRAMGSGTAAIIARVPDAHAWTDWEVYTANGLASRLAPALLNQVETGLAADGYFRVRSEETQVAGESRTRVEFEGDRGAKALLFLIRSGEELVWLVARSR